MMRSRVALGPVLVLSAVASTALAQTPDPAPPSPAQPAPYPPAPQVQPPPAAPYPETPPQAAPYPAPPAAPYPAPPAAPYPAPPPPPLPGYPVTTEVAPGSPTSGAMPAPGQKNSDDESRDSGLGLEWFWLHADLGASYVGLDSVNSSTFSLQHSSSAGAAFGLGAGVRLLFFTLGARARDLQLSIFNLWEIEGEAAFHMRIDHVDPYFGFRGGYAFDGALSSSAIGSPTGTSPDVSVHGYVAGLTAGLDYYFNHFLSLGVDLNPEFLFLQRPKVALPAGFNALPPNVQSQITSSPLYQESGTSVGFGFTGTAHLGVHL
jgi:hypothetical protein